MRPEPGNYIVMVQLSLDLALVNQPVIDAQLSMSVQY